MTPHKVNGCYIHSYNREQSRYFKNLPWWWKSASHFLDQDPLSPAPWPPKEHLTTFSKFKSRVLLVHWFNSSLGPKPKFWSFQTKLKSQLRKVLNFFISSSISVHFSITYHGNNGGFLLFLWFSWDTSPKLMEVWKHGECSGVERLQIVQTFHCLPVPQMLLQSIKIIDNRESLENTGHTEQFRIYLRKSSRIIRIAAVVRAPLQGTSLVFQNGVSICEGDTCDMCVSPPGEHSRSQPL